VRIQGKKKGRGAQAENKGAAPGLAFAAAPKILETSLDAQLAVEHHLEAEPELVKKADPNAVANAVYDLMKRELRKDLARGERER